ncbi:MAG: DUF2141 domain-containing protein [Brevundimonas sp.]|uniref:DUF2141 domain-containing protein n=1 Tax=Brevundimonas sp. TaxID=1871086 RepID=UPI002766EAC2|nr:DUF2141 domain-containing protein [Brevundimonas sp.]MDP3401355.1 DUF2141 domain-containing protein [Brevundimonas sp.]MDZ4114305.1 DUF2141 domain-containing protein [Brevundimonas sp.]
MKTRIALIAAAVAALGTAAPVLAQDSSVTFEFETGPRTGSVMVVLFSSKAGYDGNQPVASMAVPASSSPVTVTFDGLAPGSYGMKSFHDVDGDGEMDTNPFGMPIEPYAFSNNAVGNMGPASWDRARFNVNGAVVQTISLR